MSKTRAEVNRYFHGPVDEGHGNSADFVVEHGHRQRQRGRNPAVSYKGIKDPRRALELAEIDIEERLWDDERARYSGKVVILHHVGDRQTDPQESTLTGSFVDAVGIVHIEGRLKPLTRLRQPDNGTIHGIAAHIERQDIPRIDIGV